MNWLDLDGTWRRIEICNVSGTPSYGWFTWYEAPEPTDVCYDYRSPYCNQADDQAAPRPDACNDERDTIIAEYPQYSVTFRPFCHSFSNGGDTAHFTWSELNGGFTDGNPHTNGYWGIVTAGLRNGLEATRTAYNRGAIRLTSGYRCPHGNASRNGAEQSFHMQGRAGDMYSWDHPWTETEFNLLKAAGDSTSPVESFTWTRYADRHYHAAWNAN